MFESHPLVSAGLPVFNGERYLAACLEDLLAQDYPNLEIVVCDNASTDATRAILARYAAEHPQLKVELRPENQGMLDNFMRVLHRSEGEFFFWAAHDDRHDPSFVRKCVAQLRAHPEAVMCATRASFMNPEGATYWEDQQKLHSKLEHLASPARQFELLFSSTIPFEMYGLHRKALMADLTFPEVFGPDFVYTVALMTRGPFAVVDEALFEYRLTGKTVTDYAKMLPGFDPLRPRTQMMRACFQAVLGSAMPEPLKQDMLDAMLRVWTFGPVGWRGVLQAENPQHALLPHSGSPQAWRRFVAGVIHPPLLRQHAPLVSVLLWAEADDEALAHSLNSALAHLPEAAFELLVSVPEAAAPALAERLAGFPVRARCLPRAGKAQAAEVEALYGAATGELLLWLKPGLELSPQGAEQAVQAFQAQSNLVALGPVVTVGGGEDPSVLDAGFEGEAQALQGHAWTGHVRAGTSAWRLGTGAFWGRRQPLMRLGDRQGWADMAAPQRVGERLQAAGLGQALLGASSMAWTGPAELWPQAKAGAEGLAH